MEENGKKRERYRERRKTKKNEKKNSNHKYLRFCLYLSQSSHTKAALLVKDPRLHFSTQQSYEITLLRGHMWPADTFSNRCQPSYFQWSPANISTVASGGPRCFRAPLLVQPVLQTSLIGGRWLHLPRYFGSGADEETGTQRRTWPRSTESRSCEYSPLMRF